MRKGRLGRGLEALLGGEESSLSYRVVPVDALFPKRDQPRLDAGEDLDELVLSVKKHGILQPVVVVEKNGGYLIVAGERRWLAAKKAGLKEIPVVVGRWSDRDVAVLSIVENVQRKDLNTIEEALYYKKLSEDFGYTQEEIARLTGKSRAHIANVMRVLRLPERICRALREGEITLGHAKAILSLGEEKEMMEVFERVVEDGLSVRETEELVRSVRRRESGEKVLFLERYNLKARIIHGKKTSKVVITGNKEDVLKIVSLLES